MSQSCFQVFLLTVSSILRCTNLQVSVLYHVLDHNGLELVHGFGPEHQLNADVFMVTCIHFASMVTID